MTAFNLVIKLWLMDKVAKIVAKYGILLNPEEYDGTYFDGKQIFCGGMSEHDILHEVAHWVVARPEQRDLPEFGLGSLGSDQAPLVVDPDEADTQEKAACLLSAMWAVHYGILDPTIGRVYFENWTEYVKCSARGVSNSWEIIGRVASVLAFHFRG